MKKFLILAAVALPAGAACLVDGASAAPQQNILPGGCVVILPDGPVAHNQRRDPAHFVIRAEVKWFGNYYWRDSNGLIAGTTKYCAWESCYIEVNGRIVRLQGLPGDIVDQYGYRGKTLVLVGRLVQQKTSNGVPPNVLIVDSFSIVS
jgi:hypothetical protein